jgi:signal peptidase I
MATIHILRKCWFSMAIALVAGEALLAQPSWGDDPAVRPPELTEAFCYQVFDDAIERARAANWQTSPSEKKVIEQCRDKFNPGHSPNTPLPQATQCLDVIKTTWQKGLKQLTARDMPSAQLASLGRCSEVVAAYYIPSVSMVPTLKVNDRIIVDRNPYTTKSPQRGDIIVFKPNKKLQQEGYKDSFVKRIIGLPGEKVQIKQGKIYINDKVIAEKYLNAPTENRPESIVVPANSYYVLGDNRDNAYDSRSWGFVKRDLITGKVIWNLSGKAQGGQ